MCCVLCGPLACRGKGKDAQMRTGNAKEVPPSPRTDMDMDMDMDEDEEDGRQKATEGGQRQGTWI